MAPVSPKGKVTVRKRLALTAACLLICGLARAGIQIEIRGVDEEIRDNVLAYLSLARYKERELDADTVERLHNRIDREVKSALRPFGYYDPTVKSEIQRRSKEEYRTLITIDPGQPVVMESVNVRIQGWGKDDPLFQRIVNNPPLHTGDRLSHSAYEKLKGDLQRTAATYGFLDAKLTKSDLLVDPENHRASIVLEMNTGPRYRFGATSLEQDAVNDPLIRRFVRYSQNEPYDATDLLRTQFALDDSLYFATVEVMPGEPDRVEHVVPINIRAEPGRRDTYSFGAGYGTDSGPRGTVIWDRRRVNRLGHRFNMQLEAAEESQSLQSTYSIPIGDPALEKLAFKSTIEQQDLADLGTENISLEPSITRVLGRWQNVLFLNATRAVTDEGGVKTVDELLIPGISVASVPKGYLGEALFQRGFFAELQGSHHSFLGSDQNFIQLHMQGERAFEVIPSYHLLLRSEFGTSLVGDTSELPGFLRFFAGGDRSVRGFGFNDLSPVETALDRNGKVRTDSNGNPIQIKVGGRHLLTGTVEIIRDLPRNTGVAVFADFGNAFDEWGKSPDPKDPNFLEYSVGLGFRWRLPVVTIGVDVAQALSETTGPRLHINFSPKL
jgi:translocation and assembly module TamA